MTQSQPTQRSDGSPEYGEQVTVGLDIGSVSAKLVVVADDGRILEDHYVRTHGQPIATARDLIADILERIPCDRIAGFALTGNGGKRLAHMLGAESVNEIVAQSTGAAAFNPDIRTIIEMGGEDSKLIKIEPSDEPGEPRITNFAMNTVCAAGTGSFLDQQAARLGVSIEKEFAELALKSQNPPRIAGRCSVFAKTDMIHLQQEATPDHDIVAGLCGALARNFRSNICRGKEFEKPIAFQGGVALNAGMVRAFEDVLELDAGELIIPEHAASLGALGAVLTARRQETLAPMPDLETLDEYLASSQSEAKRLDKLTDEGYYCETEPAPLEGDQPVGVYLGVDVGSISTNLVLIDDRRRVVAREYLMTAGRPIRAIQEGLLKIGRKFGGKVVVRGAGTTGSGRYLTGDFIGADIIKNEITTHARAAALIHPGVDTVFEIGGQDSKYISLSNGAVVDFTMNKVCAAGTGSFLEEQAERLGVNVDQEFGDAALAAESPCDLGDRCTVFVESSLNHHQQTGVDRNDLIGGLCYSIVNNYLSKVVETRKVGDVILFQGGTAYNRGVRAAFEKVVGKPIIVPPHHDVMGAIGAALIAMEESIGKSNFKGFDLSDRTYAVETFECSDCANDCEIKRVTIEGEEPLHYGSRCGKFDEKEQGAGRTDIPRLFREREKLLLTSYPKDKPDAPNGKTVGIPRMAHYFELFPLWKAFFSELGFEVVTSSKTNQRIIRDGVEHVKAETCFPIKVAHGHVLDLIRSDVDHVFLPCVVDLEPNESDFTNYFACPYVQSMPYFVRAAIDLSDANGRLIEPVIHMSHGRDAVAKVLADAVKGLGVSKRAAIAAAEKGFEALDRFYSQMLARGREVLESLGPDDVAIALVSRPYNGCDPGLNLNLPEKLRDLGAVALPIDALPLDNHPVSGDFPHMYWKYGQRILAAARYLRRHDNVNGLYVTNFGCGPDSFISKFFEREMGGKPFLTIEIDEHSADAGLITRCEAFLESLRTSSYETEPKREIKRPDYIPIRDKGRKLFFPHMSDHGRTVAALMRGAGIETEALPLSDKASLVIGRKFTTGRECYPCIVTTGDIVKKTMEPDFDPDRSAFLMADAKGPCRFGQYNKFHRMVLDDIGLEQVPLFALSQDEEFNESLSQMGPRVRREAWRGFVLVDLLQKLTRHTRPYEQNPGETDALYESCLESLERALENGEKLLPLTTDFRRRFEMVEVDRTARKPKIGIIGEIYVRYNDFANNFLVRKLEALGAEVVLPPFEEWIDYIDHYRRRDLRSQGEYVAWVAEHIKEWAKEREVRRFTAPFEGAIGHFLHEEDTTDILERARRYIHPAVRGEATLSMGRAIEYVQHGFDGIVNVTPFNCIPGTIVNGLLETFAGDHGDIPCLKLEYDGHDLGGEELRIEAFIHQAKQMAHMSTDGGSHDRQRVDVRG